MEKIIFVKLKPTFCSFVFKKKNSLIPWGLVFWKLSTNHLVWAQYQQILNMLRWFHLLRSQILTLLILQIIGPFLICLFFLSFLKKLFNSSCTLFSFKILSKFFNSMNHFSQVLEHFTALSRLF